MEAKEVLDYESSYQQEVRDYQESLSFALSLRQFLFALPAFLVAVSYFFTVSSG